MAKFVTLLSLVVLAWAVHPLLAAPKENTARRCSDGIDNDRDGLVDGADPDCAPFTGGGGGGGGSDCEVLPAGDPTNPNRVLDLMATIPHPTPEQSGKLGHNLAGSILADGRMVFAVPERGPAAHALFYVFDPTAAAGNRVTSVGAGAIPFHARFIAVGNFDNANWPDFAVSRQDNPIYVFTHDGSTYQLAAVIPIPAGANYFGGALVAGDANGDGRDELIVGAQKGVGTAYVYETTGAATAWTLHTTFAGSDVGLSSGDGFGSSVALGDVVAPSVGDPLDGFPDLIVGAMNVKVGKARGAGQVYVFRQTMAGTFVPHWVIDGTYRSDYLGWATAVAPTPTGADLVATTQWRNKYSRADVHMSPLHGGVPITLGPVTEHDAGWADNGIDVSQMNGTGPADIAVGAPNAGCGDQGGTASVGRVYLFLDYQSQPVEVNPPDSPSIELWNVFGYGTALVGPYLLVGEPGRDSNGLEDVGQAYIYKYGSSAESVGEMQPVDLTGWCPALGKPRVFHSPTGPTNADPF